MTLPKSVINAARIAEASLRERGMRDCADAMRSMFPEVFRSAARSEAEGRPAKVVFPACPTCLRTDGTHNQHCGDSYPARPANDRCSRGEPPDDDWCLTHNAAWPSGGACSARTLTITQALKRPAAK